ncbi:OmpA family protein [Hydrogenophaga laconesensis]|uniref:Outer membrane protein OmpA-like peptidoglycan-associated protein n=1 Tax=Hydrogenophaga laconesensis TaxID=1805971 RepID=A0ABU1VFF8_9BURK|nr:OmpA family protein [Hydrogenophaga laconesensis]MDR7096202.1 outer membrane protein OmpA-like peptidoglycan-associated protein [Hydrogenophaga laconesensis]
MRAYIAFTAPLFVLLTACSSPPKPPSVDESQKRPVNSQTAIELQVCKNDLQNTRILATESSRLAETTAATLAHMAARQQLMASIQEKSLANSVRIVHFGFNSTRVTIPSEEATALVEEAKSAPLVVLRGRTDGTSDSSAESRIAQARAHAVRDYLVASGVDPSRIRATHQPSGDHLADNRSARGRNLNRRVEIEIYRVLPLSPQVSAPPHS